jgi:uncharacterized membrane protein YcjF (UPF0283 family)
MDRLFTLALRVTLIVGVLLSLVVVSEMLNLYLALRELSPLAATLFASVSTLTLIGSATYLGVRWYRHPPVLLAPPRTDEIARDLPRHAQYLRHYLDRLAENPLLDGERQRKAKAAARRLADNAVVPTAELETLVREIEGTTVQPLLAVLRTSAEGEVRRCVRDVMAGVTLSPYRSSDLLIVLYRNGAMVLRLAELYGGRPRLGEQVAIARDTLRVVAAVNFMNLGNKLVEGLFARVPMLGRFADDVAQGLGAGFLTSAVGHAAMERCEAFNGWDRIEAVQTLGANSGRFLADVRDIFLRDILPSMRTRVPQPDWDRLADSIRSVLDATMSGMDGLVTQPVLAGGRAVMRTGSGLRERLSRGRARTNLALRRLAAYAQARWASRAAHRTTLEKPPSDRENPT